MKPTAGDRIGVFHVFDAALPTGGVVIKATPTRATVLLDTGFEYTFTRRKSGRWVLRHRPDQWDQARLVSVGVA